LSDTENGHDDDEGLPVEDELRGPSEKPKPPESRDDNDDEAFPTAPEA
jgi:hypothetical protein